MKARLRAHRLLVAAATLTVLLTTSVLAALAAFGATIGDHGLRHTLEHRAAARSVIDVHSTVSAGNRQDVDRSVREALRRAYGGLPTSVEAATRSGSYALPSALSPGGAPGAGGGNPDLTVFTSLDRDRVRLTGGTWPTGGGRPASGEAVRVPVAVPELVADRLGLRTGDALRLESRLAGPPPVRAEVTGVYVPKDPADPYWRLDPLGGDGVRTLSYTTYGPLAVTDDAFASGSLTPAETYWQADADFGGLTTGRVAALREQVAGAVAEFGTVSGVGSAVASSELPDVLGELERSLLVARSTLLVAGLQLAAVAGLALLLVARLLAAERATETALLRARGGSRTRVAALAAAEALLLALPGLLLGPLIAAPVVRALTSGGTPSAAGAEPALQLPPAAWWVAAATTVLCALTVALPALLRSAEISMAPRRRRAAALLRGGFDLALLAVAGVALWQLQRRTAGTGVLTGTGPDGTGEADGLGIDPVLVTAPALALLATAVPALRALPLLVRIGERHAARGRGLTSALAGWQLGRRPAAGAGPAVLLVLAVAMGVFAVGQGASWDRSQADQAAFRTGADIAVNGSSAPAFGQGGLIDGVGGVTAAAPVARDTFGVRGDLDAQVLATDTRVAGELLDLRDDLADEPLPALLAPLAASAGGTSGGITLPAQTRELSFRLRLEAAGPDGADSSLAVTLEDRYGVPYHLPVGELPADGRAHTLTVRLAEAAGGTEGAPAGPLRLTGVTLTHLAPTRSAQQRLILHGVESAGPDGGSRTVGIRGGLHWDSRLRVADIGRGPGLGHHADPELRSVRPAAEGADGAALTVTYTTGAAPGPPSFDTPAMPVDVVLRPATGGPAGEEPLPAVATDAFLDATGAQVGDQVQAQISGTDVPVRITGALRALPTTGGTGGGALLLDLAALDAKLQAAGADPLEAEGWWVAARPGRSGEVADELRALPSFDAVAVRAELAEQLRSDPLGSGPRTALTAIAVAAAVLAAAGFAVSTAGAARERRSEHAVLRALGTPRSGLARVLAAEQGVLVLLSLAIGLGLGVLLTRLVVPLIVLTADAATPVPALIVELPPGRLALLVGGLVAAPLLVVVATALRGADPVTALRTERGD